MAPEMVLGTEEETHIEEEGEVEVEEDLTAQEHTTVKIRRCTTMNKGHTEATYSVTTVKGTVM